MPEPLKFGLATGKVDFGKAVLRTFVGFCDVLEAQFFFPPTVREYGVWWDLVSKELFEYHLLYIDEAHRDLGPQLISCEVEDNV
jgi:hypothetical protein